MSKKFPCTKEPKIVGHNISKKSEAIIDWCMQFAKENKRFEAIKLLSQKLDDASEMGRDYGRAEGRKEERVKVLEKVKRLFDKYHDRNKYSIGWNSCICFLSEELEKLEEKGK